MNRAPLVIKEVLRCRGPATGVPRTVRHDVELHGVKIPAGSRVWPVSISANRDPRVFSESERFIPDRNPKNILSFDRGIHKCLGEPRAGRRHVVLVAGGSGITPLYAIARELLHTEPETTLSLLFCNVCPQEIILRAELDELSARSRGRFRIVHVLEQAATELDAIAGRSSRQMAMQWLSVLANGKPACVSHPRSGAVVLAVP